MGVRLVVGTADGTTPAAVLYDSTTGWPVGPLIEETESADAEARAEAFLRWFEDGTAFQLASEQRMLRPGPQRGLDPRHYLPSTMERLWQLFVAQEEAAKV